MRLIGLMLARNEDWIVGMSARVALQWCNRLVVLNHASTDGTGAILEDLKRAHGERVMVCDWQGKGVWDEMDARQRTLEIGRKLGGTHFAIIDADEVPTANVLPQLRYWFKALSPAQRLDLPMIPIWRSHLQHRADDCVWTRAHITLGFQDAPGLAWRADEDGYCHHARAPRGCLHATQASKPLDRSKGGVMHLQWMSWERVLAKHRWYKMAERLRWPNREPVEVVDARYDQALDETGIKLERVPAEWWENYANIIHHVDPDRVPWHVRECERMMAEHGEKPFEGLNLWGMSETRTSAH